MEEHDGGKENSALYVAETVLTGRLREGAVVQFGREGAGGVNMGKWVMERGNDVVGRYVQGNETCVQGRPEEVFQTFEVEDHSFCYFVIAPPLDRV